MKKRIFFSFIAAVLALTSTGLNFINTPAAASTFTLEAVNVEPANPNQGPSELAVPEDKPLILQAQPATLDTLAIPEDNNSSPPYDGSIKDFQSDPEAGCFDNQKPVPCILLKIDFPKNGEVVEASFDIGGTCHPGASVFVEGNLTKNPTYASCGAGGTWKANVSWLDEPTWQDTEKVTAHQIYPYNQKKSADVSVTLGSHGGDGGGTGCNNEGTGYSEDKTNPDSAECPDQDQPIDPGYEGEGGGGMFGLTIDLPKKGAILKKSDPFTISGTCDAGYHIFLESNTQKNPVYALCSAQGTYKTGNLTWLDSVQKGANQTISGHEINNVDGVESVVVNTTVLIVQEMTLQLPACSDGLDNDNDGKKDAQDSGCWEDPSNPTTYNPGDKDEGGMIIPVCRDGIDNDNDGKKDSEDSGCWEDPNDPTTYDPFDGDEGGMTSPVCRDGIDNDNDGKKDSEDSGCWKDPNDPTTYDPFDGNEEDGKLPVCSDGVDNDNDGKKDALDPGCWTNPNDSSTYDKNDETEGDGPACADGMDNDNDGKKDAQDSGCWKDPNDPNTYDPGDNNEETSACSDGLDNDGDGKKDALDQGCWGDPKNPNTYKPTDDDETNVSVPSGGGGGGGGGGTTPKPSAPKQTDSGSVVFDNTKDPVKDANRRCLDYTPTRNLSFTDMKITDLGAKEAMILKNTILRLGLQAGQYVLSGYGSDAGNSGKATIGLETPLTRLEWTKMLMITHCFSIFDTDSLPDKRYNGKPMPSYKDFPRGTRKGWESDIIYSGTYYGIWDGTLQNNIEYSRPVKISEAVKMLVRAGEFRQGKPYPLNTAAVSSQIKPSDWYYEFYAKTPDLSHLKNPFVRVGASTIRNEAFGFLVDALLTRSVYSTEDEAAVKKLR